MADATTHGTGIEWTHVPGYKGETWNPVRGCVKISPGCKHCYAETFAERWRGVADHPYEQGFDLRLVPEKLDEPLRAKDPRAYFVNSMSDLHQEGVPHDFIRQVYGVMGVTKRHLYMVLTKRPELMAASVKRMDGDARYVTIQSDWRSRTYLHTDNALKSVAPGRHIVLSPHGAAGLPPNVWLGVSVEDSKYGLPRVDILRTIPAAVRFLSIEPLLEDLGPLDLSGIHWVIVGGESGPGARWFSTEWLEKIIVQCKAQGVPVFVKQLGANPGRPRLETLGSGLVPLRLKSKKGGGESEWPAHLRGLKQFPQIVRAA